MALKEYKRKRNFKRTPEPVGGSGSKSSLIFVVQKHHASHLHYDFRLELDGVLKSWAVPKGPSLNPADKRLAMQVEDHPYDYKDFEGTIPKGNYGAGDVIVWDTGTYESIDGDERSLRTGLRSGNMKFVLHGDKLRGEFALVRTKRPGDTSGRQWLLIKKDDAHASTRDIRENDASVLSAQRLADSGPIQLQKAKKSKKTKPLKVSRADLAPMLATLTDGPFDDPDWVFEVKWDGYRAIAKIENGSVSLYSRNGIDVTKKYAPISEGLRDIGHSALIDGELVMLDKEGRPRFQLMQNYEEQAGTLVYYAFDLLFLDGKDLRDLSLLERKEKLRAMLPAHPRIRYSEHTREKGVSFFKAAEAQQLEGIMAKRADSPYLSGKRSDSWLKVKTSMRQEAVIVGFTEPRKSRKYIGSLILAVRDGKAWRYVGHTGGGMGGHSLKSMREMLEPLITKKRPLDVPRDVERGATWVTPKLIAEIKFTEWTDSGTMRHPIFVGLRNDKKPTAVTVEKEVSHGEKVSAAKRSPPESAPSFSNTDKVYFPKAKITKGDILEYYDSIADVILPYLKDRPFVMNRHPNGIAKPGFYQKDSVDLKLPPFVETATVYSESNDKDLRYIVCNNRETLLYLANLGCIEMNPWNSRVQSLDKPDFYVIDLDPGTNSFDEVVEVARVTHEVLKMSCEESYCKTSGKTGLHIYVPLDAKYGYDQVRSFAEILVQIVHRRLPDITSLERSPAKRRDKIYLDWLQNRTGQTLAAPYSVRPAEGAPVSTPLEWKEVKKGLDPKAFTIETIFDRLKKKGDLWSPILGKGVDLKAAAKCLADELGRA